RAPHDPCRGRPMNPDSARPLRHRTDPPPGAFHPLGAPVRSDERFAMPDDSARAITDRYDREALDYRELWAPILRQAGARLIGRLATEPARRVVEVGAGVGTLLPDVRAAFPGAVIVGADRSRGMLALTPAAFPRAVMDARALALRSGSADLVLMLFM